MQSIQKMCKDVEKRMPAWSLIRDLLDGSGAIKAKGEKYLPKPNPSDVSQENNDRYKSYSLRAVLYNATSRTHQGLVGQVFAKPVHYELPPSIDKYKDNIDGKGVSLEQQAKKAVGYALAYGRTGLLSDYTGSDKTTVVDVQSGKARPVIKLYPPFDIVNYRADDDGMPSLIVLREEYENSTDEFSSSIETRYRVLRRTAAGATSQVYRLASNGIFAASESPVLMADAEGKSYEQIPFSFIGSENNDMFTDSPPLYDLAELNIGHYRNSADYEESAYICGQPTPYITGLTQQWVDSVMKGVISLGSRAAILLPAGATAGLLQATPNSLPKEAMEHKERQMAALGAKLVEKSTVERTATEVNADEAAAISILGSVTKNVEAAYNRAIWFAAQYAGDQVTDRSLAMSTDFDISRMSAGDRQQLMLEWQAGAVSFTEYRSALRQSGIATQDDTVALSETKTNPAPKLAIEIAGSKDKGSVT